MCHTPFFLLHIIQNMILSTAIRSGDYYMFDDLNDDLDLEEPITKHTKIDEEDLEEQKYRKQSRKYTVGEVSPEVSMRPFGVCKRLESVRLLFINVLRIVVVEFCDEV